MLAHTHRHRHPYAHRIFYISRQRADSCQCIETFKWQKKLLEVFSDGLYTFDETQAKSSTENENGGQVVDI